jgi:hypothetical protein
MTIVSLSGAALHVAAGDVVPLAVVQMLSDGTTRSLPAGETVTWTSPTTVAVADPENPPDDAGLPATGAQPTAFFVSNSFRPDRTDYAGALFVSDPGTADGGTVMVTASVGDAGTVSASVTVTPAPTGDATRGAALYAGLHCDACHGATGAGSPPTETDAGTVYMLVGMSYPYPAVGLNSFTPDGGAPNLAADPDWNAAMLSIAVRGDFDNHGVALRVPMPDWMARTAPDGGSLSAADFADIYAFLQRQTQ